MTEPTSTPKPRTKGARKGALSVAPTPALAPAGPGYTVGLWAGLPNYQCDFCPFATVDGLEVMKQHLFDRHAEVVRTLKERAQALGLVLP